MNISTLYKMLPIDCLQRGEFQPRITFNEEHLNELAQSIRQQGLIEPLIVRQKNATQFEIIAGERRWRAAMIAGLSEVPCLIRDYADQQAAAITLIENIQREDLSVIEEAKGYQRLIAEFCFSQNEVALLVGKSRSHLANLLRLLSLNAQVQHQLHCGKLTLGHARMLVGLDESLQKRFTTKIINENWSVRKLEKLVRETKIITENPHNTSTSNDIIYLQARLSEQVGSPVEIDSDSSSENSQGGWLKIKFYDNDTFSGLLERLGLSYD